MYYPSIHDLKKENQKRAKQLDAPDANTNGIAQAPEDQTMIVPGKFAFQEPGTPEELDALYNSLTHLESEADEEDVQAVEQYSALQSRMKSLMGLTESVYVEFLHNKNTMSNWIDPIEAAVKDSDFFKTPKTKVLTLPIELASYLRYEWREVNQASRDLFNQLIFSQFDLEEDKEYFIKTGTFSSKFEFHNAHCKEPLEMGDYFHVIHNFAQVVGAAHSNDLVVREYIDDVEDNPTIYNGMPLRTEFRAFVDFDTNTVEGVVPYWHPIVMKRYLQQHAEESNDMAHLQDFMTYTNHQDKLNDEFNEHQGSIGRKLEALLPDINLSGRYSVDVMKNGEDFYIIDLALTKQSALSEFISDYKYRSHNDESQVN